MVKKNRKQGWYRFKHHLQKNYIKKGILWIEEPAMLINLWAYPGQLLKDRGRVLARVPHKTKAKVIKISDCGRRYFVSTEYGKGWVGDLLFREEVKEDGNKNS